MHSIEPFIEDITVKVIDEVVTLTQEKSQDLKETLTEAILTLYGFPLMLCLCVVLCIF
jgi:hypothetical protein